MNRFPCFAILLVLAVFSSFCPVILQAGVIVGITSVTVTGPGGSGTVPIASGTLAEPNLIYTSIAPLDVIVTVDSANTYQISETPGFGLVKNLTGVGWSGFTWKLISESSASFVYNPTSPTFSGLDFSGTFPTVGGTATFATFSGGTLPSGSSFQPSFNFIASGPGTYTLEQTPIPAPEPSGLVLLTAGAVAALVYCRRASKTT